MALVDLEPATFLVGEEGFDMRSLFVQLHGQIQIGHICDQIEWLLVGLLPERQETDGAILLGRHPGRSDGKTLTLRRSQVANVEAYATGSDQNVRGGATDIAPVSFTQISLQLDTIKLAVAQEGDLGSLGHDRLDLGKQRTMG